MRIEVRFDIKRGSRISPDYPYHITSLIYHLLCEEAPRFASSLHHGATWKDGARPFKFFSFSQLWGGRGTSWFENDMIVFNTDKLTWRFDSAVPTLSTLLTDALLKAGKVRIGCMEARIDDIRALREPDFSRGTIDLIALSPIVASLPDEKLGHRYLSPDQPRFWEGLAGNAAHKWRALHETQPPGPLTFEPDQSYIARHRTSKTMRLKDREIIIGHLVPFRVSGPPDMLALCYRSGYGSRNSLGFGMVRNAAS